MGTKAQHTDAYQHLPRFLAELRDGAGLTQRELGEKLDRPQSWIHNCESANRRVDVTEFIAWAAACGVEPLAAFTRFLDATEAQPKRETKRRNRPT
jgi:transcriptional regulator with XRE-family HTH domain